MGVGDVALLAQRECHLGAVSLESLLQVRLEPKKERKISKEH